MALPELTLPSFLERWEDGSIRVSGHRVLLLQIFDAICRHADLTALEDHFPTISIDKLSNVLAYCKDHYTELKEEHRLWRAACNELVRSLDRPESRRDELIRRMEEERRRRRSD